MQAQIWKSLADWFGANLAELLSDKILVVEPNFPKKIFVEKVGEAVVDKTLTARVELIADILFEIFDSDYPKAIGIVSQIMWPENPKETGMFTEFYWLMPIGKLIEKYWVEYFELSIPAIAELTKRNTGEFAIRPFILRYPEETLKVMKSWAKSNNFHLRRLASEGIRPKLPWAKKLDLFVEYPEPVFEILDILKADKVKFVMKSVGNNLADYLKLNPAPALELMNAWERDASAETKWIIKHAKRKFKG